MGATSEAGSDSSYHLKSGGGVHSILLIPLVARCIETIDLCIWRMFFLCCDEYFYHL